MMDERKLKDAVREVLAEMLSFAAPDGDGREVLLDDYARPMRKSRRVVPHGQPPRFDIGDTVRLASGGPAMTVSGCDTYGGEPSVTCTWFKNAGSNYGDDVSSAQFHPDLLELVRKRDPEMQK